MVALTTSTNKSSGIVYFHKIEFDLLLQIVNLTYLIRSSGIFSRENFLSNSIFFNIFTRKACIWNSAYFGNGYAVV